MFIFYILSACGDLAERNHLFFFLSSAVNRMVDGAELSLETWLDLSEVRALTSFVLGLATSINPPI